MNIIKQEPPPLSRRMLAPKEFPGDPTDARLVFGRVLAVLAVVGAVILKVCFLLNTQAEHGAFVIITALMLFRDAAAFVLILLRLI